MNAKGWSVYRTYERRQLTFRTVEFFTQALGYAEEFLKLSNEIFHTNTVDSVIEVLPKDLFQEIRRTQNLSMTLTQAVN